MRLFVAVDVGDEVRAEVSRVTAEIGAAIGTGDTAPRVAWVAPKALHLTLRFLGEIGDDEAGWLRDALAPPISQAPFAIEWRGLGAFPGPRHPRVLWIGLVTGAEALGSLEAEVSRRIDRVSAGVEEAQPFRPHLTIGRVKTPGKGVDWPEILKATDVRGVRSLVDRITLYRSQLSPRGPNYTALIQAPLVGT
jgi:2'-5' RNA ligase